jgi:hypothetical protein
MLPASADAAAAKVFVFFFVLCYLLNPPFGGAKKVIFRYERGWPSYYNIPAGRKNVDVRRV